MSYPEWREYSVTVNFEGIVKDDGTVLSWEDYNRSYKLRSERGFQFMKKFFNGEEMRLLSDRIKSGIDL